MPAMLAYRPTSYPEGESGSMGWDMRMGQPLIGWIKAAAFLDPLPEYRSGFLVDLGRFRALLVARGPEAEGLRDRGWGREGLPRLGAVEAIGYSIPAETAKIFREKSRKSNCYKGGLQPIDFKALMQGSTKSAH